MPSGPSTPSMAPQELSTSDIFIVNCIAYSAIVFHLYEWISNLTFEISYIWSKKPSSIIKWQYLSSRYAGILIQVVNTIFCALLRTELEPSPVLCRSWHTFQWMTTQILIFSLNITLIHRVFALYERNRHLATFLLTLAIVEFINGIIWGFLIRKAFHTEGFCAFHRPSRVLVYLIAIHIAVQGINFLSILFKVKGRKSPLLSLVIRDASYVFAAMLVLYTCMLVNNFLSDMESDLSWVILSQTLFVLIPAIATTANCHMIINMEHMSEPLRRETLSMPFVFTSVIPEDIETR